jgi:fructose-bisphosphate aldolase class I
MNVRFKSRLPWALTFSFARAIQQPALEIWRGLQTKVSAAQRALLHRAQCDAAARRGDYDAALEGGDPETVARGESSVPGSVRPS